MTPEEERQQQAVHRTLMLAILNKLTSLENKMDGPQADLSIGEAVEGFRAYLDKETKRPENYNYILGKFLNHFTSERKICGINAEEIEGFLMHHWSSKNTLKHRLIQLNGLFKWSVLHQRRRNLPIFSNPCELIRFKGTRAKSPQYVPQHSLSGIFRAAPDRDILIFSILLSSGLRVSEMLKLRLCDINGRVLTLHDPKSGQDIEYAVIPQRVSDKLKRYGMVCCESHHERIFKISRQGVGNIVYRWSRASNLSLSVHALRKWCATFWNRAGDQEMEAFVLRHHPGLRERYVATLDTDEAMERQDKHLTPLFEKGGELCGK